MAPRNPQIGASPEEKLLWEILKQLTKLTSVLGQFVTTTTTTTIAP